MRKFRFSFATILLMTFVLCGCGGAIPDLSKEQSEEVSQYAASLLLKYDNENHTRLVDTKEFLDQYTAAWDNYNAGKEAYEKEILAEQEKRLKETLAQEEANAFNPESGDSETVIVDRSESGSGSGSDSGNTAKIIDAISISQFLDVDFDIEYSDFKLLKTYPERGTDFYFTMDATRGNDLLVIFFDVTNTSGDSQELNIMDKLISFKLSINNKGYSSSYKTMLEDDFSEYFGEFAAGESKKLVLISEVPEGTEISSIDMRMSDPNGNYITKTLVQ